MATVARIIYQEAFDKDLAKISVQELYPKLLAWNRWWWEARDPENTGLSVVYHPWESGMDNNLSWDQALKRIDINFYKYSKNRTDNKKVNYSERPDDITYERFIKLEEICCHSIFRGDCP